MAEPEPLCVYCRRQDVDEAWRPFCSERCRRADLGRWLSEDYRIAADPDEEQDGLPDEDADRTTD